MGSQQIALVGDDLLEQRALLIDAARPLDPAVVDAAHPERVDILIGSVGLEPLRPIFPHPVRID
jgi:hypothetical protein